MLIDIVHEDFPVYTKPKTHDNDRQELIQVSERDQDWVVRLDQLIVCLVVEGQRQHTLLLQVGLVDPRDDKIEFCLMHSRATNAYFQPQGCSPSK